MTGAPASQSDATHWRRVRITIAMVGLGQFLTLLNGTILTTALPEMLRALEMTPTQASWVITATILLNTVASPIWGRLADRYSPIALIRISVVLLIIGAIVGSLAPVAEVLIFARALQGVGFGGVFSLGVVVLANIIPPRERGRYFGLLTALQMGGQLSGPLLGGLLVDSPLGWRACLYVIIPGLLVTLVLSAFALPLRKQDVSTARIDWPGALLLAVGVSAILIWISFVGENFELLSGMSLVLLVGGVLVVVAALVVELRAASPILPLRAMTGRVPVVSSLAVLGAGMATMPLILFMSYYLQIGRGIPPTLAGVIILAAAVGSVVAAFVVGARSGRTGRLRRYLIGGAVALLLGAVGLAFLEADTAFWLIIPLLVVFGVGQGATIQFFVLAAQNAVGVREVGAVTGFMSFAQLLGASIGLSLFTAIAAARLRVLEEGGMSEAEAYAAGIPIVFAVVAVTAVVVLLLVLLLPTIRLRRTLDIEDAPEPVES